MRELVIGQILRDGKVMGTGFLVESDIVMTVKHNVVTADELITDEFEEKEQDVIAGIHRAVEPDFLELESDLALIAVVGRGMRATRGTSGRIFAALAHANVNVKMIDQGSSELNIIIGVRSHDFNAAINAVYDIFVNTIV